MKLLALALLLLALTACGPAAPVDPNALAGMADGYLRSTQQAERWAREAQQAEYAEATMQVAQEQEKTDNEIKLINAKLDATSTAMSMGYEIATATAQVAQATTTAQAAVVQATGTQAAAQVTQTAVVEQVQAERQAASRRELLSWALTVIEIVAAVIVVIAAWRFLSHLIDSRERVTDRKQRLLETRAGTVLFFYDEYGNEQAMLLQDVSYNRPRLNMNAQTEVEHVMGSASVLSSPMPPKQLPASTNTTADLVLRLVQNAEAVVGPDASQFPGWRQLGVNSTTWQRGVAALQAARLIETKPGSGTFLTQHSLGELRFALETKAVRVRPAPYPGGMVLQ